MVNNPLKKLWIGSCTVITRTKQQDPITKRTEFVEEIVYTDEPCRLSYQRLSPTTDKNGVTEVVQVPKLFLSKELMIPPGSKIIVTQNGRTVEFSNSGQPAVYSNHQEIVLELFKGWA
jgi:hypothetical protein